MNLKKYLNGCAGERAVICNVCWKSLDDTALTGLAKSVFTDMAEDYQSSVIGGKLNKGDVLGDASKQGIVASLAIWQTGFWKKQIG